MVDDKSVDVQALVVGVSFCVLQQLEKELSGLLRPTTNRSSPSFSLSGTSDTAVVAAEWNTFLELSDILQESLSATEGHALDSKCRLAGVLEIRFYNLIIRLLIDYSILCLP